MMVRGIDPNRTVSSWIAAYTLLMPGAYDHLHGTLQVTLLQRLGWHSLRPLQEETYSAASTGADLLVIAPTAGGKTEAAMLPVIDRALKDGVRGVYCIYLSPLKALINDQLNRVWELCAPGRLTAAAFHGDIPPSERRHDPDDEPHVLLITPESLEVLLHDPNASVRFGPLQYVVIDEVHAFVGTDRGVQVRSLLDRLDRVAGRNIQRIGLSATVGNPADVLSWLSGPGRRQRLVRIPSPQIPRRFSFCIEPQETGRADTLVRLVRGRRALVFARSRGEVERLSNLLDGRLPGLYCHHSSVSPSTRDAAETAAKSGDPFCIVCTSTLELGIDIGDLDLVVQSGPPASIASFLQRLGRTGRRDRPARFAFLLSRPCELVFALGAIEAASRGEAEPILPPTRPYHVLAQQILLHLLQARRTRLSVLTEQVGSLGPFQAIPPEEVALVADHLVHEGFIAVDGDLVMVGPATETVFSGSHRQELFSVLRGGQDYRAITPDGEEVGRLDARFARSEGEGAFSLGGRGWSIVGRDDSHGLLIVEPGVAGQRKAFWSGEKGGASPLAAESAIRILSSRSSGLPLDIGTRAVLEEALEAIPGVVHPSGVTVLEVPDGTKVRVLVLTPFGAAGNRVVASYLHAHLDPRSTIRATDLGLVIRKNGSAGSAGTRVHAALVAMRSASSEEIARTLPPTPPSGRAFGPLVPPELFDRMVAEDHYHLTELLASPAWFKIVWDPPENDDARQNPGSSEKEVVPRESDLREKVREGQAGRDQSEEAEEPNEGSEHR